MAISVRHTLPAAIILISLSQLFAVEPETVSTQVRQAIENLDGEDFAARAAATRTLQSIGRPAIAPLTAAAIGGELEITDRAVQILTSFYRLNDEAALDELDTALERLADSDRPSAVRRAAAAIKLHAENRERRALKKLRQLQAMIRPLRRFRNTQQNVNLPFQIWIDDQWRGGESELRLFRRVNSLRQLYRVEGCPASLDAVRTLEQIIPGLSVQERGAAYLGLGEGDPRPQGFQIREVRTGGSIDAAGLQKNDVIIRYAGRQVDNFHQLVELIKKNKVGETVKIEYLRFNELKTADVKLKSWREVFNQEAERIRRATKQPPPPQQLQKPKAPK